MKSLGKHRFSERRPMADINVTPLVDVVLVLLIIFVIAAPMLQMGIDVNLPKVTAKSVDITEEKLVLTIDNNRQIFLNKTILPLKELKSKLEAIFHDRFDREVYMRADKDVPSGCVVEVMSEIRKAGVDRLGMVTEPSQERVE
jgi:biopolymer transport protein TolR